jgi:hypothetical protein
MRRLLFFLFLVVVTSAAAQEKVENNQLGLLIGAEFISDQTTATPMAPITFGKSETFQLNFAHRLRGDGTQLWLELPSIAGPSHNVASANTATPVSLATFYTTPSFRVNFVAQHRFSPWVSFGGGYALYEGSELLRNGNVNVNRFVNTAALQFGGGVDVRTKIRVLKPIGLRAEVRDFYSLETPNFTSAIVAERQHNVVVSGGLILRF